MTKRQLEDFKAKKHHIASTIETIAEKLSQHGFETKAGEMLPQAQHIREHVFRIAVIGEFSAGKSTLLNAILGEKLLPAKMAPCTSASVEIAYGNAKRFLVKENDLEFEEKPWEQINDYMVIPKHMSDEESAQHVNAVQKKRRVIRIEAPIELCQNDVVLVDTAGLNEDQSRTSITEETLPKVDAALLLTRATQLWSKTETEAVKRWAKEEKNKHWLQHMFVAATFADVAFDDEEQSDLRERMDLFCDTAMTGGFAQHRRYFIDARSVLHDLIGKHTTSDGFDYQTMMTDITNFVVNERGEVALQNAKTMALHSLMQCQSQVNAELRQSAADIQMASSELDSHREVLQNQRERVSTMIQGWNRLSQDTIQDVLDAFESAYSKWLFRDLPSYLEQNKYPDKIVVKQKPAAEWYSATAKEWFEQQMSSWFHTEPPKFFEKQLSRFEREFKQDLHEFRTVMQSMATTFGAEDIFAGDNEESDMAWIFRSGAGWLAGGPLGAIIGANLGWGAVAANLAMNFGVGLGLGLLGVSVPFVGWLAIAATIGALQLGFGQDKIKRKIAKKIVASFQDSLEDNSDILNNISAALSENLSEVASDIGKATSGMIAQLEEMVHRAEISLEKNAEEKKEQTQRLEFFLSEIENIKTELTEG